jgi:hypothetical protein
MHGILISLGCALFLLSSKVLQKKFFHFCQEFKKKMGIHLRKVETL